MSVIFFLLPIALLLAVGFLCAFIWATRSGEFDDLETPAHRILFDDMPAASKPSSPAAISPPQNELTEKT